MPKTRKQRFPQLTETEHTYLAMLQNGPKLVAQLDIPSMRRLFSLGIVEGCGHPDVRNPDGEPADAVRLAR